MYVKEFIDSMEICDKLLLNCWKDGNNVSASQNLYTENDDDEY